MVAVFVYAQARAAEDYAFRNHTDIAAAVDALHTSAADSVFEQASVAAEADNEFAQTFLGYCYENVTGVADNMALALHFYRSAAEKKEAWALYRLGAWYAAGHGVSQDFLKAEEYFREAFKSNQHYLDNVDSLDEYERMLRERIDALAAYELGGLYFYTQSKQVLMEKHIADRRPASPGWGDVAATRRLEQEAVKFADSEALRWLVIAAEMGLVEAQIRLAEWYDRGILVEEDKRQATEWYARAAEQGDPKALTQLGIRYEAGVLLRRDYRKALELFKKAAAQNYAEAQYRISSMFRWGTGFVRDYAKAEKWLVKALENGYEKGRETLDSLREAAAREEKEDVESIDVTVEELAAYIDRNELVATGNLKGKPLKVTGVVTGIKEISEGEGYAVLGSPFGALFSSIEVECYFGRVKYGYLITLRKGDIITVRGKYDGFSGNVRLRDCDMVQQTDSGGFIQDEEL